MLVYQVSPRAVVIKDSHPSQPSFPCEAIVSAELLPEELFGMGQPPMHLPVFPRQEVRLGMDLNIGRQSIESNKMFDIAQIDASFVGRPMEIRGKSATVTDVFPDALSFSEYLAHMDVLLGPTLSSCVPVAVRIGRISGFVGGRPFNYEHTVNLAVPMRLLESRELHEVIAKRLEIPERMPADAWRFWAAIRYLDQSRRLREAGRAEWDFLGERFLNLYKAIEVLFGGEADVIRERLAAAAVSTDLVEGVFVALVYVRNQLDSGHSTVRLLPRREFETLNAFVHRAESGVEWLLGYLAAEAMDGRVHFETSPQPSGPDSKQAKTLEFLEKHKDVYPPSWRSDGET